MEVDTKFKKSHNHPMKCLSIILCLIFSGYFTFAEEESGATKMLDSGVGELSWELDRVLDELPKHIGEAEKKVFIDDFCKFLRALRDEYPQAKALSDEFTSRIVLTEADESSASIPSRPRSPAITFSKITADQRDKSSRLQSLPGE